MPVFLSKDYAESAALVGYTDDLRSEVSLRLARFPATGGGTFWCLVIHDGRAYGMSERIALSSAPQATPVNSETAIYDEQGPTSVHLERHNLSGASFGCTVKVKTAMHATGHPPLERGSIPVVITASFKAIHEPMLAREGRLEVFGTIEASVTTPDGPVHFSGPAKWHEQSGDRTSFAPRFTYIAISNRERALLAVAREDADYGFAVVDGKTILVTKVTVDPKAPRRTFIAELANGEVVEGVLDVVHETSVPIEGQRRPSTTVIAQTSLGRLVGHANDWIPSNA